MNNYSILGLNKGATLIEIKAKFRLLSKQLHPDVNGGDKNKTDRFVIVLAAYEALLKGDSGETKDDYFSGGQRAQANQAAYNQAQKQQAYQKKKDATYRFISIKKEGDFYLVKVNLDGVYQVEICGKNHKQVGSYTTSHVHGNVNLTVSSEAAKKAEYMFRITFYDAEGNWAEKTFKVTPPKVSLYQKFKNLFK